MPRVNDSPENLSVDLQAVQHRLASLIQVYQKNGYAGLAEKLSVAAGQLEDANFILQHANLGTSSS